jgi:tetratricopeptide (TPR) repeat protein
MMLKGKRKLTARERRDLDFEIAFMEGLVQRDPTYVEALQVLGTNYTERGNYDAGLKIDLKLARLLPHDPAVLYNLACSYSLTGKIKQAATALDKAIDFGFDDYHMLLRDPDLTNLRRDALFESIRDKLLHLER